MKILAFLIHLFSEKPPHDHVLFLDFSQNSHVALVYFIIVLVSVPLLAAVKSGLGHSAGFGGFLA